MKKLMYFALILILIAGVTVFGAWSPIQAEETELRYADAPLVSKIADITTYFTSKDITEEGRTAGGAPTFVASGLTNACGPVAGAEIVAFYDKYYPNLIPGWDSYYPATGKYRSQNGTYITPVLQDLYTLMKTNDGGDGVTEANFKSGLQTYFTNHGYSASFSSVKSGGTLNFSSCKTAVDSNKVIVLFTTPGEIYKLYEYSDHDFLDSYSIAGNHIMIAYGYLQIKYYNGSSLIRTDTFLEVATGLSTVSTGYYLVNSTNLEAAYVVNVN
ncbi:MAG: hypothetical protein J1F68_02460 [Clostridiales bacterium]|nr:hypothetical protein [Clostridiales bacterium]